jgi:uncharacterized SAM-binding protein YcdF (DUF218 family)
MITLFIILVLILVAIMYKKLATAFFLVFIGILFSIFVGCGFLPQILLNGLQVNNPIGEPQWKARNAIVVLGAGTTIWPNSGDLSNHIMGYSRVYEAARLYFSCKKKSAYCRVIPSGGDPNNHGISEAEIMAKDLANVGVLPAEIIVESKSKDTFQNAQFTTQMLNGQKFDTIILVTSGFHMRRALLYFSRFDVQPLAAPSDYMSAISSPLPLSFNFTFTDVALHEYVGIFLVNKRATEAGVPNP